MTGRSVHREGARHFWLQRATAAVMLLLVPLLVVVIVATAGQDQERVRSVVSHPLVAIALGVLVVVGTIHMRLGLQVVIEDYVRQPGLLRALLALTRFFSIVVVLAALYSLLQLTLGI